MNDNLDDDIGTTMDNKDDLERTVMNALDQSTLEQLN